MRYNLTKSCCLILGLLIFAFCGGLWASTVLVDLAPNPPEVYSALPIIEECERLDDGLSFTISDTTFDLAFIFPDLDDDSSLYYELYSCGELISMGAGTEVMLSDYRLADQIVFRSSDKPFEWGAVRTVKANRAFGKEVIADKRSLSSRNVSSADRASFSLENDHLEISSLSEDICIATSNGYVLATSGVVTKPDWAGPGKPAVNLRRLIGFSGNYPYSTHAFTTGVEGYVYLQSGETVNFRVGADDCASLTLEEFGTSSIGGEHALRWGNRVIGEVAETGFYRFKLSYENVGGPYELAIDGFDYPLYAEPESLPYITISPEKSTLVIDRKISSNRVDRTDISISNLTSEISYGIRSVYGRILYRDLTPFYEVSVDEIPGEGETNLVEVLYVDQTCRGVAPLIDISCSLQIDVRESLKPEKKNACQCLENDNGSYLDSECIFFSQPFGSTPAISGAPKGRLVIEEEAPSDRLSTPFILRYDHPAFRHLTGTAVGLASVAQPYGKRITYFNTRPDGASITLDTRLRNDSDDGRLTVHEIFEDRSEVVYADGEVIALITADGVKVDVDELGIEVIRGEDGAIRQIWSQTDGLMDVVTLSSSRFRVNWYAPSSVGPFDPITGLYGIMGSPAKYFDFGTPEGGECGRSFSMLEYRSEELQFPVNWRWSDVSGDWTMTRGVPEEAIHVSREIEMNDDGTFTVIKRSSSEGGDASEKRSIYSTQDGIAPIFESSGGRVVNDVTRITEGNGRGRPESVVDERGLQTLYGYDTEGRVITKSERGGTRSKDISYTYSDDGTIDYTPSRTEERVNGILVRTREYERIGTRESGLIERSATTVGEVEHSRTSAYYPSSSENRFAAGRLALQVMENGRAVTNEYCATEGALYVHTATEGIYDGDGFRTIDGKSTRTHRTYNIRGDVVRESKDALINGVWREIEWATHTYSLIHQRLGSVRSNGLTSNSSKICTGSLWEVDENGVLTTNIFDSTKRIVRSERHGPFGVVAEDYTLDAEGRKIAVVKSSDGMTPQREETTYDLSGRIASRTGVDGAVTHYSYSSDGLIDTVIYADGGTRVTTRNADGSLASITGTAVTPEYYTYGITADGLEWTSIRYGRADSPRFEKTYRNGFGETVRIERSGFGGEILVTENTYNEKGRLVQTIETGKPTITYVYDDWGDRISITQSADGVSRTTESENAYVLLDGEVWRGSAQAISTSDSTIAPLVTESYSKVSGLSLDRIAESFTVDERGNTNRTWSAVNPSTAKRTSWSTRAGVGNVAFSESIDGAMTRSVNTSAITNTVHYDAFKRQVATTDGRGNTTSYVYDELGRMSRQIDPCGSETAYVYDAMGRVSEVTNALGNVIFTRYDLRGNKTYEGGATYPVGYTYDEFGNRTSMTTYRNEASTEGDTTSWVYDEATGLVTQKLYADGHGPCYTYTNDGKIATRTWARGIVTNYGYDAWGNLTSTTYSDGTPSVMLSYDALGRLKTANDVAGTTTYTYDAFGDETQIATSGLYSKTLVRHRDAYGRDLGHSMDGSRKNIVEYEPTTGRIKRTMLGGAWFTWDYLQGSDLKSRLTYGGSGNTEWTYEPNRDLLTRVKNTVYGSVASQYDYTNDAIGRRTAIARSGTMMSESRSDAYGYNTRSELISAAKNGVNEYAYQYDDIGNRETSFELGTNFVYEANCLNQYTTVGRGLRSEPAEDDFAPQYDDDGNQTLVKTKTGIWSVTYNGENRPILWECGSTNIVMKFDRMGRRVELIETMTDPVESAVTTNKHQRFVYDGYLCIQRLNGANNAVTDLFEWDPTERVATRPLFWQPRTAEGNFSLFYTHDGNKNVSEVVFYQRARGVAAHYDYAPFGAVTSASGPLASINSFRFSSEYHDDTLGLVYYNYRPYNPLEGRWISRDIDTISDENKYLFVVNCPIVSADYIGLTCVVDDAKFPGATWCQECKLWVRKFNDNRDVQLRLVRESRDEHNKKIKAAKDDIAKLITMQRAWLAGILDRIEQECSFDTKYQKEWNKYFWIDGEDEVYRGNEINYIGIGMFEKANNIGPREWVVYSWKILNYKELPSAGTLYWYNKGFEIE